MTDDRGQQIRVPMVYSFEKDGSETVVVRFEAYVRDFNELA
jgi:protein involved in ribonucleotide reduction